MKNILVLNQNNALMALFEGNYYLVKVEDNQYVACTSTDNPVGLFLEELNCIYPLDTTVIESIEVPSEVFPGKYCYNKTIGFYINPDWKEPPKSQEQLEEELEYISLHQSEVELDIDYRLSMLELGII